MFYFTRQNKYGIIIDTAYDEKYRLRVIEYKDAGHTFKEVYEAFGADAGRYYSWKKLPAETGSLKSRLPSERDRKINKEELRRLADEHPGWYLREFAGKLNVCFQAVKQMFKKPGITRKKNIYLLRQIRRKAGGVFRAVSRDTGKKPCLCFGLKVRRTRYIKNT